MSLQHVVAAVAKDSNIREVAEDLAAGVPARIGTAPSTIPYVIAALASSDRPILVITPSDRAADEYAKSLSDFIDPQSIEVFPAWETLPHERLSPSGDTVGTRMAVLRRLAHPEESSPIKCMVAPIRSVIQPIVSGLGEIVPLSLSVDDEMSLDALSLRLVQLGFERVELVDRRGQFAVRGGIVDVFPSSLEHPVRVEFWGDVVEDIRAFSVADQRSLGLPTTSLLATACRELLIDDEVRERASLLLDKHPELGEILGPVSEGIAVEGMESLLPVLVDDMQLILDVIGDEWLVVEVDPERISARAAELVTTSAEFLEASWSNVTAGNNAMPIDLGKSGYRDYADTKDAYATHAWCEISTLIVVSSKPKRVKTCEETQLNFFFDRLSNSCSVPIKI